MTIKSNLKEFLYKRESQLYKWLFENRLRTLFFIFISFLLYGMSSVPYVNLFFNKTILLFIVLCLFLCTFVRDVKKLVILGSSLLLLSFPVLLIHENLLAVRLGDFVFGIFLLAVIYKIFEKK